jgi:O-acetyl-ADP-ribose deacetylase (regulator of RNase III)
MRVIIGDLWKTEGDVLVTGANNRLAGREGLDELMHQHSGEDLRAACAEIASVRRKKNLQPCPVGTAVTTDAFDLPAKRLIHVVSPDCRRPNQDEARRELLRQAYDSMFEQLLQIEPRKVVVAPPLSMDIFAYPHREGARLSMEIILGWLDGEEDIGVRDYIMVTREMNFINNLRTVYREGEDQLPGHDSTRDYR